MNHHTPLPHHPLACAHGHPIGQSNHAATKGHHYLQVTDFLNENVRLTPDADFTTRSVSSDLLSIYAYGITEALADAGELSTRQAKQLACELFVFHFGWATAEAAVRVNALGSLASDRGSRFTPLIEASGRAFFSWRGTRNIPEGFSFSEACGEMERLRSFPGSPLKHAEAALI